MMYQNKLVVAVKVGGKILREFKEIVKIPFGTEYSLLIKNLNSVRVQVKVSIDGTDMTDGASIVIHANDEVEIERSIRNGNFNSGNRFKFIERSAGIESSRGIKADDGLVRIQYQFEKIAQVMTNNWIGNARPSVYRGIDSTYQYTKALDKWADQHLSGTTYGGSTGNPTFGSTTTTCSTAAPTLNSRCMTQSGGTTSSSLCSESMSVSNSSYSMPSAQNENGITVPGSISHQQFTSVGWFALEAETHVMILRLTGELENCCPVKAPVTVQTKQCCVTCDKVNKATAKFCCDCGTCLTVL